MSFSLEIYVMGQLEVQEYYKTNSFLARKEYELTVEDMLEYQNNLKKMGKKVEDIIYPFYKNIVGKWYTLGKEDEGSFWALHMIDTDFDRLLPVSASWLTDEEDFERFTPVIVKKEYQKDLEKILTEMIQSYPTKSLIIRPQYQSGNNEVVQGVIPFDQYLKLLKEEKIPFNVYTMVQDIHTL